MYGHGIDEKVLEAEAKSVLSVKDMDKAKPRGCPLDLRSD